MNKKYLLLGLLGLAILLFTVIFLVYNALSSPEQTITNVPDSSESSLPVDIIEPTRVPENQLPPAQQTLPTLQLLPPEELARRFYVWYVTHPAPLQSGDHLYRPDITAEYKKIMTRYVKRGINPQRDPVFNCGDPKPPQNIIPKLAQYDQTQGQALVTLQEVPSGRNLFQIKMLRRNNIWLVRDVWCAPNP